MTFRHILVATDGSELSDRALDTAASLAKSLGARLTAVHAIEVPRPSDMSFVDELPTSEESVSGERRVAGEIKRNVESRARDAGVECSVVLAEGTPWKVIVRVAEEKQCDLIVMATHGRTGLGAVLLGSETQKVLAHTKLPVLACR